MLSERATRLGLLLALFAVFATACANSAPEATSAPPVDAVSSATAALPSHTAAPPQAEIEEPAEERIVANVNLAIADVALEDIVFDTFDGGSVTLAAATEEQIQALLNAIPPIDDPQYVAGTSPEAAWVTDDDIVLGFVADDGSTWAHPHRVLNFHEIVNTTLGGQDVAVTYCPLCGSGVVFDRRPNDLRHDGVLTFDNTSALYENDMVMVDEETHTYWWQVSGRGLVGNLTGTELTALASTTTSWAQWLESHPDTMVLSNDQGRGPSYAYDPFVDYGTSVDAGRFAFPVSPAALDDDRLSLSTRVIGFELDGAAAAVAVLGSEPAVIKLPGAASFVVFLDGRGGGSLFAAEVQGVATDFSVVDGSFVDAQTGSSWDTAGRAVAGPALGDQLAASPSRTAYWFAWLSTTEGHRSLLFGPDGEIEPSE